MGVIHQCRPHSKGEVGSSPGRCRLARLLSGVAKKASKEKTGESWDDTYKEMGRAVGLRSRRKPRKQKPSGK